MSREVYIIEALPAGSERRPRRFGYDVVAWRDDPHRGLHFRSAMFGPFFDYGAAHAWFDAHLDEYPAMIIHPLVAPDEEPDPALRRHPAEALR